MAAHDACHAAWIVTQLARVQGQQAGSAWPLHHHDHLPALLTCAMSARMAAAAEPSPCTHSSISAAKAAVRPRSSSRAARIAARRLSAARRSCASLSCVGSCGVSAVCGQGNRCAACAVRGAAAAPHGPVFCLLACLPASAPQHGQFVLAAATAACRCGGRLAAKPVDRALLLKRLEPGRGMARLHLSQLQPQTVLRFVGVAAWTPDRGCRGRSSQPPRRVRAAPHAPTFSAFSDSSCS